jgi:hypothetical protein
MEYEVILLIFSIDFIGSLEDFINFWCGQGFLSMEYEVILFIVLLFHELLVVYIPFVYKI